MVTPVVVPAPEDDDDDDDDDENGDFIDVPPLGQAPAVGTSAPLVDSSKDRPTSYSGEQAKKKQGKKKKETTKKPKTPKSSKRKRRNEPPAPAIPRPLELRSTWQAFEHTSHLWRHNAGIRTLLQRLEWRLGDGQGR